MAQETDPLAGYQAWLQDAPRFLPMMIQSAALARQYLPELVDKAMAGSKPGAATTETTQREPAAGKTTAAAGKGGRRAKNAGAQSEAAA
jgi:hypothetical protein